MDNHSFDGLPLAKLYGTTFVGVFSRGIISIALTHACLNDTPICACDVHDVYSQSSSSKKHCATFEPECGLENVGKYAIIVRTLYGGKSVRSDY